MKSPVVILASSYSRKGRSIRFAAIQIFKQLCSNDWSGKGKSNLCFKDYSEPTHSLDSFSKSVLTVYLLENERSTSMSSKDAMKSNAMAPSFVNLLCMSLRYNMLMARGHEGTGHANICIF